MIIKNNWKFKINSFFLFFCIYFFMFSLVFALDNFTLLKNEIDNLNSKIENLDNFFKDMEFGFELTNVFQNVHNVNLPLEETSNNRKSPFVSSYSLDFEINKAFDKKNKIFLELEAGQGSIDNNLNLFSSVNDSSRGSENISISDIYLEHKFFDGLFMNIGKISANAAIDQNEIADDEKKFFLSGLFVNSSSLDFPLDDSFGVQCFFEKDLYDLSFQYVDAIGDSNNDLTKNIFSSFQFNLKPSFFNLSGNYRFYVWHNSSLYSKNCEEIYDNYGYGISFDQKFSKGLGAFFRYGYNNDKVIFFDEDKKIDKSFSFGLILNQKFINEEDFLGVAYGELKPNKAFNLDKEKHLELFYNLKVSDFLSISPDFQYIKNPFGKNYDNDIFVYGIRTVLNF